jgi:hypothetical protein
MKTQIRSPLSRNGFLVVSAILSAIPALANNSKFSFTMKHQYVNGAKNNIRHDMDRGTLIVSGELWTTSCPVDGETGVPVEPDLIRIAVKEEGLVHDPTVCSFSVTPSAIVGKKVHFEMTCDNIHKKTKLHLVIYQTKTKHCIFEATGSMTTK